MANAKTQALLCSAALGALVTGLLAAQAPAHADIGLAKGGRGTAYVTILGGYQQRDGGAAVAPSYVATDELTQYRANLRLTMTTQLHRSDPVAFK